MRNLRSREEKITDEIINELTNEINSQKAYILSKVGKFTSKNNYTFQQFNGRFGGKNNTYVDSVRTQFLDFEDFYAQWIKGLIDKYDEDKNYQIKKYGRVYESKASFVNLKLIQDKEIESFVRIFLERNFYNKIKERTRVKPNENLWSIWFGYKLIYGLLIAPVLRKNQWTNDKSEIRKVDYSYWTIGHVLEEGLIDPKIDEPINFINLDNLLQFYSSVLKRLSSSNYAKEISNKYVDYIKQSENPNQEPFLIPEVRYLGLNEKHLYRLDFTTLNIHTLEYTGFEISPASTHINVKNLKQKQNKVNKELQVKWEKEMKKRNDYFHTFDITIITFTDTDLADINSCFDAIKSKLSARKADKIELRSQLMRLSNIK